MLMHILCYESSASLDTQETLWICVRKCGWMSAGPVQGTNRFFIPEDLCWWALLIDPNLRRLSALDYIV